MAITLRNFNNEPGYSNDYRKLRDFIILINQEDVVYPIFLWGGWEWVFKDIGFEKTERLSKIGMWEEGGNIVALATFESDLGEAYLYTDKKHTYLKEELLIYAQKYFKKGGRVKVLIRDCDSEMQRLALSRGLRPTQKKMYAAALDIDETLRYSLPKDFSISSVEDEIDIQKFTRVLWRGFNHEGEPPEEINERKRKRSISGPNQNNSLNIKTIAPNGDYASYCGMWYDPITDYAYVEPVATDPDYRMMGLGKAAVLEGAIRCGKLGAKKAYVISSQQFYYNIGFYPVTTETWWE